MVQVESTFKETVTYLQDVVFIWKQVVYFHVMLKPYESSIHLEEDIPRYILRKYFCLLGKSYRQNKITFNCHPSNASKCAYRSALLGKELIPFPSAKELGVHTVWMPH